MRNNRFLFKMLCHLLRRWELNFFIPKSCTIFVCLEFHSSLDVFRKAIGKNRNEIDVRLRSILSNPK